MAEGVIHNQVSLFLMDHLPFGFLKENDLLEISKKSQIKYFDKGDTIFEEGGTPPGQFYVIKEGSVELLFQDGDETKLSEICDVGDIFGIKAIIGARNYINTAKAHEETLVVVIPYSAFVTYIENDTRVAMYFAAGFSSGRALNKSIGIEEVERARKNLTTSDTKLAHTQTGFRDEDALPVFKDREVIYCTADTSIKDAATIMSKRNVGSILILDIEDRPIGIVTDVDFRKKVVPKEIPITSPVSTIMSSPVMTVGKEITIAKSIITMMQKNVRHLCITVDGTPNTRVEGIVTEHDILILQGNNPAVIAKEILQAKALKDLPGLRNRAEVLLHEYLKQEVSMAFILDIITEVNDALIIRIIQLCLKELETEGWEDPGLRFSWLSLGSEGRKEQPLRTDQDNAIIYENPAPGKEESANKYFLELGKKVTKVLNECGFKFCPGDVMASNPKWCGSQSTWEKYFRDWIYSGAPDAILNFSIFFDFRSVFGDPSFAVGLNEFIQTVLAENKNVLRFLAANAVSNSPPIGLFRGFIVDRHGQHKNEFDIKARGTMPIVDAARVLCLEANIQERNTIERYKALAKKDTKHARDYEEAAVTFEILSRFRTINTIEHPDKGNYINPNNLNKIEKETLKHAFQIIQELQKRLEVHFRLDLMSK